MAAPSVYGAITAITAELAGAGIPKSRFNEVDEYKYRSIDDVLSLCAYHHREQHVIGEVAFEERYDIELSLVAAEFARRSPHRRRL